MWLFLRAYEILSSDLPLVWKAKVIEYTTHPQNPHKRGKIILGHLVQ